MAAVNFSKDSNEWKMFSDFWNIFKAYYTPEEEDIYWQEMVNAWRMFTEKYKNNQFAIDIAVAVINDLERRFKNGSQLSNQ